MNNDYDELDKAHEVWEKLHELLKQVAFTVIDAAELNDYQEQYVINKLHEEHRFWR